MVGVYVINLNHLSPADHSFGADYWIWSDCGANYTPLTGVKMINGRKPDRGDEIVGPLERVPGRWWAYRKVSASFDHEWDMAAFPFDHHTLEMVFEYTDDEVQAFRLLPDLPGTRIDPEAHLDGWSIGPALARGWTYTYPTVFGDPKLAGRSTSDYSRLTVSMAVERTGLGTFAKLIAGVVSAVLVAQLSFRLDSRQTSLMSSRMSMVVGALFAVVVNMRAVESVLGRSEDFTLIDRVHLVALAQVVICGSLAILSRRMVEEGREELAAKVDRWGFVLGFVWFFGAVGLLIGVQSLLG